MYMCSICQFEVAAFLGKTYFNILLLFILQMALFKFFVKFWGYFVYFWRLSLLRIKINMQTMVL